MAVTSPKILEAGGTEVSTAAGGAHRYRKPLTTFRWCDIQALLSESFGEWNRHKGPRLGAALAFYTLLSLTPLLLIAVGIAGLVFGREAAQSQIVWQIQDLAGPSGAQAIKALLEGARNTTHGILATVLGLLTLLFGASGVLIELRDALNTIWEVPPAQHSGLQNLVDLAKERMFSFALVLAIGFLLLVSLAINACISALGAFSAHAFPLSEGLLHIANTLLSFIVITGLFAAIYRILPDIRIEWRDVALGAAVTSLLFTLGKLLIGLYLGNASFASTYGAAASIVLLIVWVYYSGQIFFLGAEFTKVFADRYGSQPARHPDAMVIEKTNPSPPSAEESKIIAPSGLH
jgi:membrane protein